MSEYTTRHVLCFSIVMWHSLISTAVTNAPDSANSSKSSIVPTNVLRLGTYGWNGSREYALVTASALRTTLYRRRPCHARQQRSAPSRHVPTAGLPCRASTFALAAQSHVILHHILTTEQECPIQFCSAHNERTNEVAVSE
jgi:hypothetical protein